MEGDKDQKQVVKAGPSPSVGDQSGFPHPCSLMNYFFSSFLKCLGLLDHGNDSKDPEMGTRSILMASKAARSPIKPRPNPGHGGQINKVPESNSKK
ncbi:hypothetical protein J5N97_006707 [Dioscorea zingiberensis]|uniref:Uncharacterized protein n=1 Tax=Dioscorea zingiberensis TaxID=325984 RepID=A0A9D5HTT9_9LILI|nr:hypothetical protein J5N97_006707 [Dioscorea zingiberensis]